MSEPPSSTTNDDDNFRIIQSTSFQKKSDTNMEKHKNLFHCSLCDELVNPKKAKLMPCLHTICAPCEISADKIEDMIICAKCNQKWTLEDITHHYLVRASYTTLIKCTSCFDNLLAKFKCSDCDDFICSICANAHRRVKLTKHHCLTELNADCPTTEPCNKHSDKRIDKFCITCSDLLCDVCQSENHSGHVIQSLEERVFHYNKIMMSSLDKLKTLSDQVDKNDKSIGKYLKDIDEFEQEIKDHLRLLVTEIEATCADKRKPFLKLKSCSDTFSSAANQVASFVEATLDCPNKVVALCYKDIIHSALYRASELFSTAKSLTPNFEFLSPLPNAKKIVDRLVIDVATADDQSNQTTNGVASGTTNGTDVHRNESKCVTPPARLSISPSFGCSRQQTTTSDIPAEVTNACSQTAGHALPPRPSVIHVPNDSIPTTNYAPVNAQPMVRQQSVSQTMNAQAIPSSLVHQTLLAPSCFGRLLETGSSDQNQNQYYQQQHLQQTNEKRLPPNCEVIFNKQGFPILVDHVNKTTSYFQHRLPVPTQQMASRNLPTQQQPHQATSFNSQLQQQSQQQPQQATSFNSQLQQQSQQQPHQATSFNSQLQQQSQQQPQQATSFNSQLQQQSQQQPQQATSFNSQLQQQSQQQPQQATSFNSQLQQQSQQPPRNWQHQSSSCHQVQDNMQFFNPAQFQLYQQQLQQQMANFGPSYNSRFFPPTQQPLQPMQSLLHQRLTQQHQSLRLPMVTLIDPPQYSLHQNLPGFNPAGSPNDLPSTVQQLMSPPATVDQTVSPKDKKANPKKRSKQTNSRPAKVQAVERSNVSKGSAVFPEQLSIATDVYKNLILGPLSENVHFDHPVTYLLPKQKNPAQHTFIEEIEQRNDQELVSSSKKFSTISNCPPSISPTSSLPMLTIEESISGSTDHDESNQINNDTNSLLVCASPLVTPTNNNNANLQNHLCFSIANDKNFSDVISTTAKVVETDFEEECCVCQNGNGPLLHCSGRDCFRSYHLNHHIPQYEKVPDNRFVCCLCMNIVDHKTIEDKTRSMCGMMTGLTYMTEYERKVCERILLNLFCHTESLPFHTIEKEFYDNFKNGVMPMDLKTIKDKLHSKIYSSVEEFIKDVNKIFINCNIYHDSASENGQKGEIVGRHYLNLVQEYIPRLIGLVKLTNDTATKN